MGFLRYSCLLLICATLYLRQALGIKLKFRYEECMQYELHMYEPFYGSFVALPDLYSLQAHHWQRCDSISGYALDLLRGLVDSTPDAVRALGLQAKYDLIITSPSGTRVHETHGESEAKFHLVPYETGNYRFCIRLNQEKTGGRYVLSREVLWDLHIGHADTHLNSLKEHDTEGLWHYVHQVDAQLQQLRATQQYLYWRERRHRMTVESTNRRVLVYALVRSGVLVIVSLLQAFFIRRMFAKSSA